jgi:hypothetical protein
MSIKQKVKKRRLWLEKRGDWELQLKPLIEEALARDNVQETAYSVSGVAKALAGFYGTRGELSLFDGDAAGWSEVQRSFQYWKLVVEVEVALYRRRAMLAPRTVGLETTAMEAALCACCALAFGRPEEAWLVSVLADMRRDQRMVTSSWWKDEYPAAGFIAALLTADRAAEVSSPHAEVLRCWDDDVHLRRALLGVCDYHVGHMSTEQYHEFANGPFALVPFEVLAVFALRKRSGRPLAPISHGLLTPAVTEWEQVQPVVIDDPILWSLVEKAALCLDS